MLYQWLERHEPCNIPLSKRGLTVTSTDRTNESHPGSDHARERKKNRIGWMDSAKNETKQPS